MAHQAAESSLSNVELALLNGGPDLAAIVVAALLRRDGRLELDGDALIAVEPLGTDTTATGDASLERELIARASDASGLAAPAILRSVAHSRAASRMMAELTARDLLRPGGTRPTKRGRRPIRHAHQDALRDSTGPQRLALLIALFGGAVLWSADPALARAVGAPLQTRTAEYGYDVAPTDWPNSWATSG